MHGALYQNDDVAFGERASRVGFVAQADGVAGITVTNLDQFGPERSYTLTAWEAPAPATASPAPLTPSPAPATPTALAPLRPSAGRLRAGRHHPAAHAVGESRLPPSAPR